MSNRSPRARFAVLVLLASCAPREPPEDDVGSQRLAAASCSSTFVCNANSVCGTACYEGGDPTLPCTCGDCGLCDPGAGGSGGTGGGGGFPERALVSRRWKNSAGINRCVEDVVAEFHEIPGRITAPTDKQNNGTNAVFGLGVLPDPDCCTDNTKHWQGVQRLNYESANGGTYFAVSKSGTFGGTGEPAFGLFRINWPPTTNHAGVARSSRHGINGWRTNTGWRNPNGDYGTWAYTDWEDGTWFNHIGGFQIQGDVAAVPISHLSSRGKSKVVFFDLSNALAPARFNPVGDVVDIWSEWGNVGFTKLASDNSYLVMVGDTDSAPMLIYRSAPNAVFGTNMGWRLVDRIEEPFGSFSPQNAQIITQCDGTMFVVASQKTGWQLNADTGEFYLTLHKYELFSNPYSHRWSTVAGRYVYRPDGSGANPRASGGTFISGQGQLSFYMTEYANEGPVIGAAKSVRFTMLEKVPPTNNLWYRCTGTCVAPPCAVGTTLDSSMTWYLDTANEGHDTVEPYQWIYYKWLHKWRLASGVQGCHANTARLKYDHTVDTMTFSTTKGAQHGWRFQSFNGVAPNISESSPAARCDVGVDVVGNFMDGNVHFTNCTSGWELDCWYDPDNYPDYNPASSTSPIAGSPTCGF